MGDHCILTRTHTPFSEVGMDTAVAKARSFVSQLSKLFKVHNPEYQWNKDCTPISEVRRFYFRVVVQCHVSVESELDCQSNAHAHVNTHTHTHTHTHTPSNNMTGAKHS